MVRGGRQRFLASNQRLFLQELKHGDKEAYMTKKCRGLDSFHGVYTINKAAGVRVGNCKFFY